MGRLCITLQEQNPAGFVQMLKKKVENNPRTQLSTQSWQQSIVLLNSHVNLSVYVGDEDSTTAAHIKEKVPYSVEKWTDIVHPKRSLTTRLYNLSQHGKL